jgi:hypothetical protein
MEEWLQGMFVGGLTTGIIMLGVAYEFRNNERALIEKEAIQMGYGRYEIVDKNKTKFVWIEPVKKEEEMKDE